MYEQLSFFEAPPPRSFKYSVFLAIFPDHYIAEQIIDLGNKLRQTHSMRGRLRPISHLHVSLLFLGGTPDVPEAAVETIGHVCKAVTAITNPFEIKFSRVLSFRGHLGNHPMVLVDDDHGNDGVRNLRRLLSTEFLKYLHSTQPPPKFVPHLTLLYDKHELAPKPIEPVSWMVKEIVLVRSEAGATKYHWLGRWALGEQGHSASKQGRQGQ
jgi:RNA 2',3'-cyclic 3'-phosphodiesterase